MLFRFMHNCRYYVCERGGMKLIKAKRFWLVPGGFVALMWFAASAVAGDRSEQRQDCANFQVNRQALFGDLHVHSSYSFDSYVANQKNTPWDAYRYAKGEAIMLPDAEGEQTVLAQLRRPLDFTAVTDHAEFLGEMNICTADSSVFGYWMPHCIMTRASNFYIRLMAADYWVGLGVAGEGESKERSYVCSVPGRGCDVGGAEYWQNIQRAAEEHYDRSADCSFTTFIAYEYTDAPNYRNMHRNVVFRNENVTKSPIDTYDTGSYQFPVLWQHLREQCIDGQDNCDVLAIPHNSNLAGGLMFRDPQSEAELQDRLFFEPVVELTQHKAASECRYDRLLGRGVGTEDELCTFEQNKTDNLLSLGVLFGELMAEGGAPVSIDQYASRNMVRNVLKDGLAIEQANGVNPFVMGFIGSTDTHSASPGGAEEDNFTGHLGQRDAQYRSVQDHFEDNPGGLAVVWAEENSRDAIFDAIRRKETYATSGTRPIVRFFGGVDIAANACASGDISSQGYRDGVPMGGRLPAVASGRQPRFLVTALKDAGTSDKPGNDLQRVQIVKGWVDAEGASHEKVIDIAGRANNGADVDPASCQPRGTGLKTVCTVWEDSQFDSTQRSFYYVRVLENPSCRWSTLQCQAAGVNPFAAECSTQAEKMTALAQENGAIGDVYGRCCIAPEQEPFYERVIQERAWTSPIWYSPE